MKGLLLLISLWLWGCCDDTTLVIYGLGSSAEKHTLRVSIRVGQKLVRAPPKAHVEALAFSLQRRVPAGQAIDILVEEVDASGLVIKEARQQVTAPDQDCWVEAQMDMAPPKPITQETLNAVWGSGDEVWAVGENSTVLYYNGISKWAVEPVTPCTGLKLRGVWGSSSARVWAVGHGDDGASALYDNWRCRNTKSGRIYQAVLGVNGVIYLAGYEGDKPILSEFSENNPASPMDRPLPINPRKLRALAALGGKPWALAEEGDVFVDGMERSDLVLPQVAYALWSDGTTMFAVANKQVWSLNGNVWNSLNLTLSGRAVLRGLWGDLNEIWAVGQQDSTQGIVARFDRAGKWRPLSSPTTATLNAIWGDANSVWLVGSKGTVLHYYLQP